MNKLLFMQFQGPNLLVLNSLDVTIQYSGVSIPAMVIWLTEHFSCKADRHVCDSSEY